MLPDFRFEIVDGHLCRIDEATGEVSGRVAPIGTSIVQVLPVGSNLVVREDYYNFPPGRSNVYCLNSDFDLVWSAELPHQKDAYANPILESGRWLYCASWDCMNCTLDPETGRIVKSIFTK